MALYVIVFGIYHQYLQIKMSHWRNKAARLFCALAGRYILDTENPLIS